ncbi:MAG: hypothetical protein IIC90_07940 [Chloroflexi bacterium]|nr:hypothetical protein [Chloroflexota bacterium]
MARIRLLGLAMALVLGLVATNAAAGGAGTVSIDSRTIDVGQQGTVTLAAADRSELLGAWAIDIRYDPAVVHPADCIVSENSVCRLQFTPDSLRILGTSAEGLAGDFTLATITFNCEAEGSSSLSIILQVWGSAVGFGTPPPEIVDGAITCVAPSSTAPLLPETGTGIVSIDSLTITVGQQGTVTLTVADFPELLGAWAIDIRYDPAVVQPADCVPIENSTCDLERSESALRIRGVSAGGLTGDFTLATIAFNCETEGSSSLSVILDVWGVPGIAEIGFRPPRPEIVDGAITCVAPSSTTLVLPETGTGAGIGEGRSHSFIIALAFAGLAGILAASARRMLSSS